MVWKTPSFWSKRGFAAKALHPLASLYQYIHQKNYTRQTPYQSPLPVICIGNIVAGGGGKSPAVHALLALIKEKKPAILLRGYGGSEKGPLLVNPTHDYKQVGDEALLHRDKAPTIISVNRAEGAKLAEEIQADLIVMDDGFQNNQLAKNISFLVIDEMQGIGNGLCLPAGPLREPVDSALARSDAVLLIGDKMPFETDKPVFRAHIETPLSSEESKIYLGFCGIGVPDKFKKSLVSNGFRLADFITYSDHYPFTKEDIDELKQKAEKHNAVLITTEKDYVRLPPDLRGDIQTLPIRMVFEKPDELANFIAERL